MTMKIRKFSGGVVLLAIVTYAFASSQTRAAVVATYAFTSSSLASSDSDANSTAGNITPTGLATSAINTTVGNPAGSFVFAKGDMGTSFNASQYIALTVTANSGFVLNLNGNFLTFDSSSQFANKTGNWAVYSSVDNYNTALSTGTTGTTAWNGGNASLGSGFDGLNTVTFRIHAWKNQTDNVDLAFDNIILNGVTAVPEPANAALSLFGIAACGVAVGRRAMKARKE